MNYRDLVVRFYRDLLNHLFPERLGKNKEWLIDENTVMTDLVRVLEGHTEVESIDKGMIVHDFFNKLPEVRSLLEKDIDAIYCGDPASRSRTEILISYPGFYAIAAYRIAHILFNMGVPLIPRVITEHAHSHTGVDIHPGATIGEYLCIDHGTGVVIGETAIIMNHVKIYQGVTLGALSIENRDMKGKRHPTIEDHVVIYAQATILGGETTIGHHSIIGGNVWLTRSVPPHSKIYYRNEDFNHLVEA